MTAVQVLIVDDSVTIRAMLEQVISAYPGCQVVGVADNVETALKLMKKRCPDVMTLDLTMPGIGGLQFLRDIDEGQHPPVIVVSSTTKAGAWETTEAIEAGAASCFDKAKLLAEAPRLLRALRKFAHSRPPQVKRVARRGRVGTVRSNVEG